MARTAGRAPDQTRRALLDAAARVVRERGVSARLDEIAQAAGVSKGGLLYYYANKDELLDALAIREPRSLRDAAIAGVDDDTLSALRSLLSRPLGSRTKAIVKATSFVSDLAPRLHRPGDRSLLLYATPLNYIAGILAGMEWAHGQKGVNALVSVAGDTPFFPENLVAGLASKAGERRERIVIACSGGRRHPVFALWPLSVRHDLADALAGGERRVSAFIERHPHVTAAFAMATTAGGRPRDPFFNVNTPEDLEEAEAMLPDMEQEATGEPGATVQR